MKAGREIDALIAEKVMDLGPSRFDEMTSRWYLTSGSWPAKETPNYSTNIVAAWDVVERIKSKGFGYCIEQAPNEAKPTVWFISKSMGPGIHMVEEAEAISEKSETMAHSICLAALKALDHR